MKSDFDIIIQPNKTELNYWKDLWEYRDLFYILSWKDIKVRYKQTVIGLAWSVIKPLLTMIIFTFVFGSIAKLPSEGDVPYAIMVFAGLLPWQFFSTALTECSGSLIGNTNLISKVYFPRLIIPVSTIVNSFIDFAISFGILILLMIYYQFVPSYNIIFLPFLIFLTFCTSLGFGLWFATLNVKFRDFRYVIPFIVQLGVYVSPVGFKSSIVPQEWMFLYSMNPLVAIIDGFRWCIIGGEINFYITGMITSFIVVTLALFFGVRYFRKMEQSFADYI
ncbi:ABC transporter permease [Flavobacteriaceae bacterium]|nr:ABC transporter permease [Flavobacteriaceae bacterium]